MDGSSYRADPITQNSSGRTESDQTTTQRANSCMSPEIQHLIVVYAKKAVSAERQLAQYIDECRDILALMESLQKACMNTRGSLRNEEGDPNLEQNRTTIIEQTCEKMKSLLARVGPVPYQEVRSGESSSWHHGSTSERSSSIRCSSPTHGAHPKHVERLIDEFELKSTTAEIKLAQSVEERNSLRKELEESFGERNSLRKELEKSFDERESLRRELTWYVEEPTLAHLRSCTSNVETAITQCAEETYALMESTGSVNENLLAVMRKLKREKELGESERLLYENIAWQAVLCKCMFRNFENPSFNVKHTALFKELVTKKKGRFRYYMSVKDMDPHDLYSQDKSFFEFVHDKRELLRTVLIEDLPFFTVLGAKFSVLAGIPSKFLKLGHRVWCLHKLAFAYEPDNAKIVNVREDSVFEEDHMFEPDDIRPQEDPHASSPRTVALMTVPGFTLGNSIIRAKVCCIQSLTP